ncbi:MAG: hypothetical protein MJ204_10390 [Bacteroidales bacterium]|nr:hypothetical protein [Bacteroidales bacterium]
MRKLVLAVSSIVLSATLFFGCGNEDDDVRNSFCGKYTGVYETSQMINGKYGSSNYKATMAVKKNEGKKYSVVVYDNSNNTVIFSTEGMNVVNTEFGDAYCGNITAGVADDEDGIPVTTSGVAVSADGKYSCVIAPNQEGKLVLSFEKQQSYVNSGGMEVLKTYSFSGVRE